MVDMFKREKYERKKLYLFLGGKENTGGDEDIYRRYYT